MTLGKLREFLSDIGISMSAGYLSNLLMGLTSQKLFYILLSKGVGE
ncbi:hypothetical protein [Dapis sp. BLCC M229]